MSRWLEIGNDSIDMSKVYTISHEGLVIKLRFSETCFVKMTCKDEKELKEVLCSIRNCLANLD